MNSRDVAQQLTEHGFCKYNLFASPRWTPDPVDVERLAASYPCMTLDPYSAGNRLRAYIQVRVDGEALTFGKFEAYQQSRKYNPITGDTVRDYPSIEPQILASEVFQRMLRQDIEVVRTVEGIPPPESLMIGVHLFRYKAGQQPAYSSPAWLHRDNENISTGRFCQGHFGRTRDRAPRYPVNGLVLTTLKDRRSSRLPLSMEKILLETLEELVTTGAWKDAAN